MSGSIRIVDMPDIGAVTDTSSFVGEHAGSGRFTAPALRSYTTASLTFSTMSALRANASAKTSGTAVSVGGYYTVNDGGGGVFVCNTADTTTADNGGTVIVDTLGQRWARAVGVGAYSVRWFGAKGDGTTDDRGAIQAAIATAQPVYIPPGVYLVKDAITCANPGQLIHGAGRAVSVVLVNATFNMSAQGVFVLTSGEPAAYLKGFNIRFVQPDTAARGSLTTYPPAIYANAQPRFVLEEMRITNATIAVDMRGNSGGAYIRDLQASFYTYGVTIDGCTDTVRISDMHCAGFEMTANQLSIAQSSSTTCIASGRCDALKLDGCLFLFYSSLSLFAGGSGYTFGAAVNCGFDSFNGIAQNGGGRFACSACYFTSLLTNLTAVVITSGTVYISNCWFGQGNAGTIGFVTLNAGAGATARLLLDNSSFEHDTADVPSVMLGASGTGESHAQISNCYFNRAPNTAYSRRTVSVLAGVGTYLTMTGCRTPQIGSGSGTLLSIATDNLHRVVGNVGYGWTMSLPTPTLAAYTGNNGGIGNYLTGTGSGSLATTTAGNAAQIVLTAGDWDVHGRVVFTASGGAAPTAIAAGISATSGVFSGAPDAGGQQSLSAAFTANTVNSLSTTTTRISISATTTIYLVAQANFPSGSVSAAGFIGARQAT